MTEITNEIDVLKAQAKEMNLRFHPKIGLENLRLKIKLEIENRSKVDQIPTSTIEQVSQVTINEQITHNPNVVVQNTPKVISAPKIESKIERITRLKKESHKLIRIRLTNMNPTKKDYPGEIFTVGNSVIGTVKRYIPYNADNGWHVEYIIYQALKERKCQIFYTYKLPNGEKAKRGKLINEFAIEILPQLTKNELHDLAIKQAMSGSVGNDELAIRNVG